MSRKLLSVWLSLLMLLFSLTFAYADTAEVKETGTFLDRNIVIDGAPLYNYYLDDSLLLFRDITYVPINAQMQKLLGFTAEVDSESRTITLTEAESSPYGCGTAVKNNLYNLPGVAQNDFTVILKAPNPMDPDVLSLFGVESVAPMQSQVADLAGYPIYKVGNVYYFPLRILTDESCFDWSAYYDYFTGLFVSTNADQDASNYWHKNESLFNQGLAAYICSVNKSISKSEAVDLAFIFKHEAKVSNVDEELLLAVACKESSFWISGGSCRGTCNLMGIMQGTAKGFGLTDAQWKNPHFNIQTGATLLGGQIRAFGSEQMGLTAYNQGSGTVKSGRYSLNYSNRVLTERNEINAFLKANGYTY